MRKWYGEGDLPVDGDMADADLQLAEAAKDTPGDAVLVLSAETGLGEQIVLQLILARCENQVGYICSCNTLSTLPVAERGCLASLTLKQSMTAGCYAGQASAC